MLFNRHTIFEHPPPIYFRLKIKSASVQHAGPRVIACYQSLLLLAFVFLKNILFFIFIQFDFAFNRVFNSFNWKLTKWSLDISCYSFYIFASLIKSLHSSIVVYCVWQVSEAVSSFFWKFYTIRQCLYFVRISYIWIDQSVIYSSDKASRSLLPFFSRFPLQYPL